MKKLLALLLAVLLTLSFAACGGNGDAPADNGDTSSAAQDTDNDAAADTDGDTAQSTVTEAEKQAALDDANSLLRIQPFSHSDLISYLVEFEGHAEEAAAYAADNCGADWNEQAVRRAQYYLNTQTFTRDDLISQLEYDGFTHDQAVYGVDGAGL